MAQKINLDAMISREDFSTLRNDPETYERIQGISITNLLNEGFVRNVLRKPDFQRETNHWTTDQIVSLLECFLDGELIPSVILWESQSFTFVIDGGHRLSVLRAWLLDDYGDGQLSSAFFGGRISRQQIRNAERTREKINQVVGSWEYLSSKNEAQDLDERSRRRAKVIHNRALPVQWVVGNAEKAEASFFKINTQGTPLDKIEEILLKNRQKSVAIAGRAVVRAGKGHKYWSSFSAEASAAIERKSVELHNLLFHPELETPIKTLDLPLGGPLGVRSAIEVLIDLLHIAHSSEDIYSSRGIEGSKNDDDGTETVAVLDAALRVIRRITGNEKGSLGLHPAVYFYGQIGRHSVPMFMGTFSVIKKKIRNNDKEFFYKFSKCRKRIEDALIEHKELISQILQKARSEVRSHTYAKIFEGIINVPQDDSIDEAYIISISGMQGKILVGDERQGASSRFSDATKSSVFIQKALASALRCTVCGGYLDAAKSISYDHITPKRDGGAGIRENCDLTHPFCNNSIKN